MHSITERALLKSNCTQKWNLFLIYFLLILPIIVMSSHISCVSSDCKGTFINCKDDEACFVDCNQNMTCSNATIYAPIDANLTVNCMATKACIYVDIFSHDASNLHIFANADGALQSAAIYCPEDGICSITASDAAISDVSIFSVDGLKNISLVCSALNCYDEESPPHLYCGSELSETCDILYENNEWNCADNNVADVCHQSDNETKDKSNEQMLFVAIILIIAGGFICICVLSAFISYTIYEIWKSDKGSNKKSVRVQHQSPRQAPVNKGAAFGKMSRSRVATELALKQAAMKDLPDDDDKPQKHRNVGKAFGKQAKMSTEQMFGVAAQRDLPSSHVNKTSSVLRQASESASEIYIKHNPMIHVPQNQNAIYEVDESVSDADNDR